MLPPERPSSQRQAATDGSPAAGSDILPYVVPMFAYVGLTALEGYVPQVMGKPSPAWYPIAYARQAGPRRAAGLALSRDLERLSPGTFAREDRSGRSDRPLVCAGLGRARRTLSRDARFSGSRSAFDPLALGPAARWAFIAVRLLGLVVVVPVIEELFWRSFLMRWMIDNDFWKVPIGKVTPMAAAVTSVLFALAHPEWLPALLTGALWAWLLWCDQVALGLR